MTETQGQDVTGHNEVERGQQGPWPTGPCRPCKTLVSILVFYSEKKREPVKGVIQLGSMGFAL